MHMPYQLKETFVGVSEYNSSHTIAVVGAGYDGSTSFRPGARFGPSAIRSASLMLTDGENPRWPVDLSQHLGDAGNIPVNSVNYHSAMGLIEQKVYQLLSKNTHVITLGGDHSISLPCVLASSRIQGPLAMIHFDAHPDTWSSNFDEPAGHGTWLKQAIDAGAVNPVHAVSVGIRSPSDAKTAKWLDQQGGTTIPADQVVFAHPREIAKQISKVVKNRPTYLSLDIDVLDPAYAPGTGTPEIGGPSTAWLNTVLDCLLNEENIKWVGMDVVEVCPPYDTSGITALAAATFAWKYACAIASKLELNKNG
jgi:agmatinase